MKRVIFLFLGIVGFASILSAAEQDAFVVTPPVSTAQDQAAQQPAFQWQDSLGGIQKTTAGLLEINRKLAQEYSSLSEEATGLQAEIDQKNAQNKGLQEEIVTRQMELLAPVEAGGPVHDELVLTQKAIAQEKQVVSVLNVKQKSLQSRSALLQLKIKELELDKRALLVDQKTRQDLVPLEGKAELSRLTESVASLRGQEQYLREKIAGISHVTAPRNAEDPKISRDRMPLQAEASVLAQEKADLVLRLKERSALMNSSSYKRYLDLAGRKEAFTKQSEDLKKKKALLEAQISQVPVTPPSQDAQGQIKNLNDENAKIDEEIGDLRENIAVLEYKINSLERYQNRNKDGT